MCGQWRRFLISHLAVLQERIYRMQINRQNIIFKQHKINLKDMYKNKIKCKQKHWSCDRENRFCEIGALMRMGGMEDIVQILMYERVMKDK